MLGALDIAATDMVAPGPNLDIAEIAPPQAEALPQAVRWPGWARLVLMVGGSGALWVGIGLLVIRALHHG